MKKIKTPDVINPYCAHCGDNGACKLGYTRFRTQKACEAAALREQVASLTRERDAAETDLVALADAAKGRNLECRYCSRNFEDTDQCNDDEPCFAWRGPCADNAPEGEGDGAE